jgi:ABC-type transport system substrate-binding protein
MATLAALAVWGCGGRGREPVVATWVVGQAAPTFDPHAPPDPVRWAIERLLSTGLMEEDPTGRVVPAAAESVSVSADGLAYTFRLRRGLTFADGTPCRSEAFRQSLEAGLNRLDHATYTWLLSSVVGMDKVRAGRPLPPLGIATPDERTVVLRLSRPDPDLLRKLALPGAGTAWRGGSGEGWRDGIGPFSITHEGPNRLTLARRRSGSSGPDTLQIRFVAGGGRARALLRVGLADLVWPPPPDLLEQSLPAGYQARSSESRPSRRLMLVMRSDLPPTSKEAARHALAHGIQPSELIALLAESGEPLIEWLPGGPRYEPSRHDPDAVQTWLERGHLGRSLHVVMGYSADGVGARIARAMQAEWARLGLDVEMRPWRQPVAGGEMLKRGGAQLLLVEAQALLDTPGAELASLAQPLRGPSVGAFRTGWATREFDRWILGAPGTPPLDLEWAQQRLTDEHIVVPLARLPWVWVERPAGVEGVHPRYGPDPASLTVPASVGTP